MRLWSALILLLWPGALAAQECEPHASPNWVCEGEVAEASGYIVPPSVLDLRMCIIWEEEAALVPEMQALLLEVQQQRDQALRAYESERQRREDLELALSDAHTTADVVWTGLGAGGAGILIGVLIGALL